MWNANCVEWITRWFTMSFDPNKTGVFEPYKPSKAPEIALGLIVMVLLVATLVWLLSVA